MVVSFYFFATRMLGQILSETPICFHISKPNEGLWCLLAPVFTPIRKVASFRMSLGEGLSFGRKGKGWSTS